TMVPLRFVSEALGADVRWDSRQDAVFIDTQGGQVASSQTYRSRAEDESYTSGRTGRAYRASRTIGLPRISSVTENLPDRWLLAGETLRIHMRATPGGRAYFRIRG